MKKIITIAVATIMALGVTAAPATAETLYRNGANKVTIKPVGAPADAHVTKARVTVKKGKKTVARNKKFYKAKKGKYKVTSTITYRALTSYVPNGTGTQAFTGTCRVTQTPVVLSDRTSVTESNWNWNEDVSEWIAFEWNASGQATIGYAGTCTDWFWVLDRNGYLTTTSVTWDSTWQEDEYINAYLSDPDQRWTDNVAGHADHVVGDVVYAASPTTMPTVSTYAENLTTVKNTRTVVVR